jgi:hypothetical protein
MKRDGVMSEELRPCRQCNGLAKPNCYDVSVECFECGYEEETAETWNANRPITLDQAKQILAEAGMVAVSVDDCIYAANTMEVRNMSEEAAHHRFMAIEDKAAQDKPDA